MPCFLLSSTMSSCRRALQQEVSILRRNNVQKTYGCDSIWFTAGTTVAAFNSLSK